MYFHREIIKLLGSSIIFSDAVFNNCQVGPHSQKRKNDFPLPVRCLWVLFLLSREPALASPTVPSHRLSSFFPQTRIFFSYHMWSALRGILTGVVSGVRFHAALSSTYSLREERSQEISPESQLFL